MIIVVNGSEDRAKMHVEALRASQIGQGKSTMIVLEPDGDEHQIKHQIEKLLTEQLTDDQLDNPPKDLNSLKWKPDPVILVYGNRKELLKEFDEILPGFTKFHGPISEMQLK